MQNTGPAQPILCDGIAALVGAPGQEIGGGPVAIGQVGGGGGGSGGSSSGGSGMGAWGVLAIILLVLTGISAAYVYMQRLNPPPPPQGFVKETGTAIPQAP